MKKIIIAILSVTALMAGVLFLAFTESGNRLILPFVDSQVKESFKSVKVKVLEFRLKPGSLYAKVKVNDTVDLKLQGPVDYLNRSFDLDYQADAQKIETEEISINKAMHVTGKATGQMDAMHIVGSGDAFASKITYDMKLANEVLQNIKFELNDASVSEFLVLAGQKPYARGKMTLTMNMAEDNEKNLVGQYTLKSNGNAVREVVKKAFDMDLGQSFTYQLVSSGKIKGQKIYGNIKANTTMGTLTMPDMTYDHTSAKMYSSYHLYIPDLSKLQPLTQRRFRGDIDFIGKVTKDKALTITGNGKEFDGEVEYKMVNDHINAHATGTLVSKIIYMLGYPQILEALTEAKVNYNFTTQSGDIDANMDNARLLPNSLTKLVMQLLQIDLEKITYPHATFTAKIQKDISHFNFNANNPSSHFNINQGTYNKRSQAINAQYDILVDGKAIKGKIGGTVDQPKVSLDPSVLLKSKIGGKVDNLFDKEKTDDKVKGLLKGLIK